MAKTWPFSQPSGVHLIPEASGINNLGSAAKPFANVYASGINGTPVLTRVYNETPTGDTDGINKAFRFVGVPYGGTQLQLFKDGLVMQPTNDYTVSSATATFVTAPAMNSRIWGTYEYQVLAGALAWDANVVAAWQLQTNSTDSMNTPSATRDLVKLGAGTAGFTTTDGRACPTNFNANNYYYRIPTSGISAFNGLSTFTVEFDVYNFSVTNGRPFFTLFDASNFLYVGFSSLTNLQVNYANTWIVNTTTTSTTWHNVGIAIGGGRRKIYLDNTLVHDSAGGITWGTMDGTNSYVGFDWYLTTTEPVTMRNLILSNIARTSFPTVKV